MFTSVPDKFDGFNKFALRWRTEAEVVSGAGESTCGNTRCKHHDPEKDKKLLFHTQPSSSRRNKESPNLNTLELPFGYVEDGQLKSALVKVVLCDKCVKKIMWKRRREKEAKELSATAVHSAEEEESQSDNENEKDKTEGEGEKTRISFK
ncbi:hypothetical protein FS842_011348 [Serendipita sp. 407]|nr:hypothetical protein FS842_011348 [Serendipita sp. 407]